MPPKVQLTPEEKKELKLLKKAQKKTRVIEKKKQVKRDELDRELKYGQVTLVRHEKEWRRMLINISIPEMKKDLEFAWHNFERVIDCKDFKISLMMDELDQAKEQYFLNFKTHTEHIDMLIGMFEDRLKELSLDYKNQLQQMQLDYEANTRNHVVGSSEEENYLKTILFILQKEMKEIARTRQAEYYSKLEEEDCKQNQIIQTMRGVLEQVHGEVWADTVNFLNTYKTKIKERKKMHTEMKIEDDKLQMIIKKQLEHIRKAYNIIRGLRVKKQELEKFLGRKLGDLQSEFDFFSYAFDKLKTNLIEDREVDFQKLNLLTINYHDIISHLEKLEVQGKHVLHVAAVCRKLETLEEKILPFPVNFMSDMSKMYKEEHHSVELELFWQRVGQADASRYAINEEKEYLLTENEILKRRIHKYCQCLQCPDYEMFKTKVQPCSTVTEGAHEAMKYKKHRGFEGHSSSLILIDFGGNNKT